MDLRSELFRACICNLIFCIYICELELVQGRAIFSQRLHWNVDVLHFGVVARVEDLTNARLVVLEQHERAQLTVTSGVELSVQALKPGGLARSFV